MTCPVNAGFWAGKRVLVTGHTGFKGGWLVTWLAHMGAHVAGIGLAPDTQPALFDHLGVADMCAHHLGDIRDGGLMDSLLTEFNPQIVLHLAAQALVRRSYDQPLETFSSNVMGTAQVLQSCRLAPDLRVVVSVTTDKVYDNRHWPWGYRENDPLGGDDPYSASKAAAELVTHSFRQSFLKAQGVRIATARAGNVIGGGDFCADRIIPDAVRAFAKGDRLVVRNPLAVRPWQLVIEPLAGYLILAQALWEDDGFAEAWNFGPDPSQVVPVGQMADLFCQCWGQDAAWDAPAGIGGPKEAQLLLLDPAKARTRLNWRPRFDVPQALAHTAHWYKAMLAGADPQTLRHLSMESIADYLAG